jgi:hypothetical protein
MVAATQSSSEHLGRLWGLSSLLYGGNLTPLAQIIETQAWSWPLSSAWAEVKDACRYTLLFHRPSLALTKYTPWRTYRGGGGVWRILPPTPIFRDTRCRCEEWRASNAARFTLGERATFVHCGTSGWTPEPLWALCGRETPLHFLGTEPQLPNRLVLL